MANDRGYVCKWLVTPPEELVCKICHLVAREPHQHGSGFCGELFCGGCVRKRLQNGDSCPCCPEDTPLITFQDARAATTISALVVECDNIGNGCEWSGKLGSFDAHMQLCGFALVNCLNQCKYNDQPVKILRKDLEDHCHHKCLKRQFECPHCHELGEYWERTTTHLDTCPNIEVKCPNAQCEINILRCDVQDHRTVCEFEQVPCRYAAVGCERKPFRQGLLAHERDDKAHLTLAMETILSQQEELTQIKNFLKKLEDHTNKLVFKMTHFIRWRAENEVFFGPAFYTTKTGYKMRVEVHANGCDAGRNTHVTVAAHLMKGDHDDTLVWPFNGKVTFELLNQLEDKSHHKLTVIFPPDQEYSQRVVEGEHCIGCGVHEFIAHQDLDYKPDQNCQYLKNDTLVFRISIAIESYQPWLECTM